MWLIQAAALALTGLGVAFGWVRARRARSAVAELVVQLSESPPQGGLRDSLASTLGDPELTVGYPIGEGRHVDARGNTVQPAIAATRHVPRVRKEGALGRRGRRARLPLG